MLEVLYLIFRVTPWHRNVARALLKEPKFYFYDNAMVLGNDGVRLENLVACALLKDLQRAIDVDGADMALHYIRDNDGREVNVVFTNEKQPVSLVEVKWYDAKSIASLRRFFPNEAMR